MTLSKIWQTGRKLSAFEFPIFRGSLLEADKTLETILLWVSTTPLGIPVVPEV